MRHAGRPFSELEEHQEEAKCAYSLSQATFGQMRLATHQERPKQTVVAGARSAIEVTWNGPVDMAAPNRLLIRA